MSAARSCRETAALLGLVALGNFAFAALNVGTLWMSVTQALWQCWVGGCGLLLLSGLLLRAAK